MSGDEGHADDERENVTALDALEAAIEGISGSVALSPAGPAPALGGEMLLGPETMARRAPGGPDEDEEIGSDTVRAGLRQAGPLAIAGVAINGINVIVTILVARLLTTRGYGLLNQLTGIFLIISMPGSAIIVGIVRRVTMWTAAGESHRIRDWARRVHTQGTIAALIFFIAVIAGGQLLADALGQPNAIGVVAIIGAGAVWILLSLDRGLLQAHRDYPTLAKNLIVEGVSRTVMVIVFVVLGTGASGIACGILLAEIITAVHARVSADRAWDAETLESADEEALGWRRLLTPVASIKSWLGHLRRDDHLSAPPELRRVLWVDLVTALITLAMLALLQNIDIIVLGRQNPAASGSYAAVSVASKAIVYGAVVLGSYLLPEAAIRWHRGGHALRQMIVAVTLLSVPALSLVIAAVFFPRLLLTLVFSSRYLGAQAAFAPLVGAMICLSLTVILSMYVMAIGRRWIAAILVVGGAATTLAVIVANGDPVATARSDFAVQACILVVLTACFSWVHRSRLPSRSARRSDG